MGYRGKVAEQARARELRAQGWTLQQIADELSVAKSSVSLWVRDVDFEPRPRSTARRRAPNALQRRKQAEIDELMAAGRERIGRLSERDLLIAGVALYAGEGSKRDGQVNFANSDPRQIIFFCHWLRTLFDVDESRLRVWLYLHEHLDLAAAIAFWSDLTAIPPTQFGKPYRAVADPSIRRTKHVNGCVGIAYACSRTHRSIMGLVHGLLGVDLHGAPDDEDGGTARVDGAVDPG
jgi:transcriptional regulator with XRE-family HTH domain